MPHGAWDSQESLLYLLLSMWLCCWDCVLHSVPPKHIYKSRCCGWSHFWSSVKRRYRWRAPWAHQVLLDNEIPHQGLSMLFLHHLQPSGKHKYMFHLEQQCYPEFQRKESFKDSLWLQMQRLKRGGDMRPPQRHLIHCPGSPGTEPCASP